MAGEAGALGGEPVEVGGEGAAVAGGAENVAGVVVGEEEEEVGLAVAGAGDTWGDSGGGRGEKVSTREVCGHGWDHFTPRRGEAAGYFGWRSQVSVSMACLRGTGSGGFLGLAPVSFGLFECAQTFRVGAGSGGRCGENG